MSMLKTRHETPPLQLHGWPGLNRPVTSGETRLPSGGSGLAPFPTPREATGETPVLLSSNGIRLAEWYPTPQGCIEEFGETRLPSGGSGLAPCPTPQEATGETPVLLSSNGIRLAEWYPTPQGCIEGAGKTRLHGGVRGWHRAPRAVCYPLNACSTCTNNSRMPNGFWM